MNPLLFTALLLLVPALQALDLAPYYDSCQKKTSLCFGIPDQCVASSNCKLLFRSTYQSDQKQIQIQLLAPSYKPDRYIAVEFSNETRMSGLVVECYNTQDKTKVDFSFNTYGKRHNEPIDQTKVVGYKKTFGSFEDNTLYCRWTIDPSGLVHYDQYSYDFYHQKYYIHLAMGPIKSDGHIGYHDEDKIASSTKISLNSTSTIHSSGTAKLIRIHASLMIFAWIGCVTVAIIIARFSRGHYPDQTLFGLKLWCVFHRVLMVVGWLAMVASYVVIFVYYKGWNRTSYHSVAGMTSGVLATLQICNSFLRPEPNSKNRWIFDYVHWFMGNIAHLLAISNILLSSLKRIESFRSLVISYIFVYLIYSDFLRKLLNLNNKYVNAFVQTLQQHAVHLLILTIFAITGTMIEMILVHG